MPGDKYIALVSGRKKEKAAIQASAGAADAGKIPALNSTGKLDLSMMPTGIGPDTVDIPASEALSAGNLVSFWDDAGTVKTRKADATATGKEAQGFVLSAVSSGATATVYPKGIISGLTGLTKGARYYLHTTAGAISTTVPSAAGNIVQYVGKAISTTELLFEPEPDPVELA